MLRFRACSASTSVSPGARVARSTGTSSSSTSSWPSVIGIIDAIIGSSVLGLILTLVFLLPSLAVTIRRLHDTDRSGWWILIGLIPLIGAIVLIVFACQDSQPGGNQYGPSPKYGQAVGGGGYPAPGGAY